MELISLFDLINIYTTLPATIIFFMVGLILTIKTGFLQLRAFPQLIRVLRQESEKKDIGEQSRKTLSSFKALFTAMATTIGMGNVVGPSVAIMMGGPGALFWIVAYQFFGGVIKFVEVSFALATRVVMPNGRVVGGPSEYLSLITPILGRWYGFITIFLFTTWSALQSNTLGQIFALEGLPTHITGGILALILASVVFGGISRIGTVASILVPIMFVAYVSFALVILIKNASLLPSVIKIVFVNAFGPQAIFSGMVGGGMLEAMRCGIYRGIFITEAGLGTSSIPHSLAEVKRPTDQGILAMYSIVFDAFLSILSGLIVLITGVWRCEGLDSTVIYQAFSLHAPFLGRYVLLLGISLFVITTVIGNTLNGSQSFAGITKGRFVKLYLLGATISVFFGALGNVPLLWQFSDLVLTLVAIPNVLAITYLAFTRPETLKIK